MAKGKQNGNGAVATASAKTIELAFVPHETKGETKNCFRFEEQTSEGQPPKIGTLYVQKWALGGAQPPRLIVKIEVP